MPHNFILFNFLTYMISIHTLVVVDIHMRQDCLALQHSTQYPGSLSNCLVLWFSLNNILCFTWDSPSKAQKGLRVLMKQFLYNLRSMLCRAFAHIISDTPLIPILSEAKKVSVRLCQYLQWLDFMSYSIYWTTSRK